MNYMRMRYRDFSYYTRLFIPIDLKDFLFKFITVQERILLPKPQVSMKVAFHNRQLPLKGRYRGDVGLV